MRLHAGILATLALSGALAAAPAPAGYRFTTVDGPAPNAGGTQLAGINNAGKVAGVTFDADGNEQGFYGVPGGKLIALGLPFGGAGTSSQAIVSGINDNDEILGYVPRNPITGFEGFFFELFDGELITFPVPSRLLGATARSMNDDDVIVGSFPNGPKTSGYTLDVWNHLTAFDAVPGAIRTVPSGINNEGTVVGTYQGPRVPSSLASSLAGFLRNATGKITLLTTPTSIGGVAVGLGGIVYNGINDDGATAGYFLDPASHPHGFVRDASGHFTLIQHPSGPTTTRVYGINDRGTIVGNYFDAWGNEHGFIATP
jgi:hypothetical protein